VKLKKEWLQPSSIASTSTTTKENSNNITEIKKILTVEMPSIQYVLVP